MEPRLTVCNILVLSALSVTCSQHIRGFATVRCTHLRIRLTLTMTLSHCSMDPTLSH